MDVSIATLKRIFEPDRRHVVPMFQRPYVWRADGQWKPLWEDVQAVAERLEREEDVRPHFLGTIVLNQVKQPVSRVETRLVIDGQQRLTTLQLLLEAASDICRERHWDDYHRAFSKLTRNEDPLSRDLDDVYKVWPTNADRNLFRSVMDAKSSDALRAELGGERHSWLAQAYLFFSDAIRAWLAEEGADGPGRIAHLYTALREKIHLVVIDLGENDDPQIIFETLNARGTPLLPADLIKNHLLYVAQREGASVDHLHKLYWKRFDEESEYWRAEIAAGRVKRSRIDLFLQHYLAMASGEEVQVGHLYAAFRSYLNHSKETAELHLSALGKYASVFQSFDSFDRKNRVGMFLSRLEELEVTTAHPLLLHVFSLNLDPADLESAVVAIESFLVRRLVCHLTTKNYNRIFLDALKAIRGETADVAGALRRYFLQTAGDTVRWPSDRELREAWLVLPTYKMQARRRTRVVLEALELASRGPKTESADLQRKLTIEHILPQSWEGPAWPLDPSIDPIQATEERNHLLHTIGNLTLLTNVLNPAVSNGPWQGKRQEIQANSLLILNKEVSSIPTWDESAIRARGARLFEIALRLWPRPLQPEVVEEVVPSYSAIARRLMDEKDAEAPEESIGDRVKCPIPGCSYAFKQATLGWDGHVGSLKKHANWHPEASSPEARRKLFRTEFPEFEGEEPLAVGAEYWERRADAQALSVVEECARLLEGAGLTVRWTYAKYYIALGGPHQHFAWFKPQREGSRCSVHIRAAPNERSQQAARIADAGLTVTSSEGNDARFKLGVADVAKHRLLLQELLESAFRRASA